MLIDRRLAAIMVADIAAYSTLMERDETGTYQRLKGLHEQLIRPLIAKHDGRVVKTTGDGFLATFSSGTAALRCGIEIQRLSVARESAEPEGNRFHLRIGINLGDIIVDGDDVSGDGVNIAARLEPLAPIDGICVSGALRDQVREELDVLFEDIGEQRVKNFSRPIRAYTINLTSPGTPLSVPRSRNYRTSLIGALACVFLVLIGGLWYYGRTEQPRPSVQQGARVLPNGNFAGMTIGSALVIGNGKYRSHDLLDNAGNDAIAIATSLRLQGVPVVLKLDQGAYGLRREIDLFKQQDSGGGVKLFFFAGHGWNIDGKNYLFPTDAKKREELLAHRSLDELYAVDDIYRGVSGKLIVLLDTHGNPTSVPDNVVLTFSGSVEKPAFESYFLATGHRSNNSPYTASVIEMLAGNDEALPTAFLRLAQRVSDKTEGKQIPWVSPSIAGTGAWSTKPAKR